MHVSGHDDANCITAHRDPRVFPLGRILRNAKIDELPQLWNVIRGDMSLVGPRPEDPRIVSAHYTDDQLATLSVRPGLTSVGSLYYYTHCEQTLGNDPETEYVTRLMPLKLAMDLEAVKKASFVYELRIVGRTALVLLLSLFGKRKFREPSEVRHSRLRSTSGTACSSAQRAS